MVLCCFFNKEYSLLSAKMLNFNNLIVGAYEEFCICYLFLVLCGTFPWITSCSGDDVEEVVSVQDVPSDISLFVSAWFPGAMIEQISRINEGERVSCSLVE